jgi:acetolactate synthase-1/2/3 large subunit
MGYGMGAVMGGCIAKGRKRAVLFTGDGSFGMNLNELATAVSQDLPLVTVILNNGVLGMVRQWQKRFFGERYSQTTLERKTDFVKLAEAFGATGYQVSNSDELSRVLEQLPNGPCVIDCRIDADEEVLPMIPPGKAVSDMITERYIPVGGMYSD